MKTKVKGDHVMGWVRGGKKYSFFSPSSFSPKQSLYRTCVWANLFDMEKMWKQQNKHAHIHTQRYLCWSSELELLRDKGAEMVGWLGMILYFVQSLREHSGQEVQHSPAQISNKFLGTQESKEKGQQVPPVSPYACHTVGTKHLLREWKNQWCVRVWTWIVVVLEANRHRTRHFYKLWRCLTLNCVCPHERDQVWVIPLISTSQYRLQHTAHSQCLFVNRMSSCMSERDLVDSWALEII